MLKKTIFAMLGLTANGIALAGGMGPVCEPGNVTVPCDTNLWSFGLDALYLNLNSGNPRAYDTDTAILPFVPATTTRINDDWNWGYRAELAYQYNTGNDAAVNWIHISDRNEQVLASGIPFNKENRFDQVQALLGQHVDFSATHKARFYGGMTYAQIEQDHTYYNIPFAAVPGLTPPFQRYDNTYFKGFGPTLGIDYTYYVSNEISLIANGATSVLYGSSRASNTIYSSNVPSPIAVATLTRYASKKTVVPAFEAKLGINYAYQLPSGTLNLEGGYLAIQYIEPIQTFHSLTPSLINGVFDSNFGLYGPYFGAKYVGNV